MKLYIYLLILVGFASCAETPKKTYSHLGTWECYHKELDDGTTISKNIFTGEEFEYSCDGFTLVFKADSTATELKNDLNLKYVRNDSIITMSIQVAGHSMGDNQYIIEKLTDTELILTDYDTTGSKLFGYRKKYRRVN